MKNTYRNLRYLLWQRKFNGLTSPIHVLPDFIVIGVGRGGTTTLHHNLSKNPCLFSASYDETGFFDENFHLGLNWYRSLFPSKFTKNKTLKNLKNFLAYEVTPAYIRRPWAARRIAEVLPNVKLIAILRNPVDRTYSHYNMSLSEGNYKSSFEDVVNNNFKELEELSSSYEKSSDEYFKNFVEHSHIARGFYAEQLKIWFNIFGNKQIHITSTENLAANPQQTFSDIFKFLEVPDYKYEKLENKRKGNYLPMQKDIRNKLSNYFKPYNEELFELIDQRFDW
tara:strand:+ start:5155 stop:5997 length:843 start_codon:yes stop_codon:yes gene_type:complete